MSSMIKMQVIGHLGKDCIMNQVNGKNVINFTVAHTDRFRDSQGVNQEKTTWVECAYWTDRTAVAPYLKKGTLVFVDGIPEVRTFTRNDGSHGAALNLRVREVHLLGGGSKREGGVAGNAETSANNEVVVVSEEASDDLPF
ncbi:MAG TPA: single-stranded DNA-binding protein [Flavisolibacter sp.]